MPRVWNVHVIPDTAGNGGQVGPYGCSWSPSKRKLVVGIFESTAFAVDGIYEGQSGKGLLWPVPHYAGFKLPSGGTIGATTICYSPDLGLWVASCWLADAAHGDIIAYSSDGFSWTAGTWVGIPSLGNHFGAYAIAWSPSLALFSASGLAHSSDGINWTDNTATNPLSGSVTNAVCWSDALGIFCCARAGFGSNSIATSVDGINWTGHNIASWDASGTADAVIWCPNASIFLMVGSNSAGSAVIATSPDGITWTDVLTGISTFDNGGFGNCAVEAGTRIYVGGSDASGNGILVYSNDGGVTWTQDTDNPFDNNVRSLYFIPDLQNELVMFGSRVADSDISATLYDGPWTTRLSDATNPPSQSVWSPATSQFVTLQSGDVQAIMASPDGITWSDHGAAGDEPADFGWYGLIGYEDSIPLFVAGLDIGGGGGGGVATSSDGHTWIQRDTLGGRNMFAAAYSPSLGLWAGAVDDGRIWASPDAITWTPQSTPWDGTGGVTGAIFAIAWSPALNLFAAAGFSSGPNYYEILTSPDGITWTEHSSPLDIYGFPYSMIWSDYFGKFILAGTNVDNTVTITTSNDGVTWTAHGTPFDHGESLGLVETGDGWLWISGYTRTTVTTVGCTVARTNDLSTYILENVPLDGQGNTLAYSPSLKLLMCGAYDSAFGSYPPLPVIMTRPWDSGVTTVEVPSYIKYRKDGAWHKVSDKNLYYHHDGSWKQAGIDSSLKVFVDGEWVSN